MWKLLLILLMVIWFVYPKVERSLKAQLKTYRATRIDRIETYMRKSDYSMKCISKARRYFARFSYELDKTNANKDLMVRVRRKLLSMLHMIKLDLYSDMKSEIAIEREIRSLSKETQYVLYKLFGTPFDRLNLTAFNDTFQLNNEFKYSIDFT